jgi:hypothetical protein
VVGVEETNRKLSVFFIILMVIENVMTFSY